MRKIFVPTAIEARILTLLTANFDLSKSKCDGVVSVADSFCPLNLDLVTVNSGHMVIERI